MAINRDSYERIYGSALFDELHNFFPELMYDERIFSTEPYMWMRHRMTTLFPDTFARQRTLYNIYHAAPRRTQYENWRFSNFPSVGLNTAPRSTPAFHTNPVLIEPVRRVPIATTPIRLSPTVRAQAAPRTYASVASAGTTVADLTSINNLFNNVFGAALTQEMNLINTGGANNNTMFNNNDLIGLLAGTAGLFPMTDVPVIPSSSDVESHSEIYSRTNIPSDTICGICQEHNNETIDSNTWRRLHCAHYFHRACIDQWFARGAYCPLCRHDIRVAVTNRSTAPMVSTIAATTTAASTISATTRMSS